MVAFRLPSHSMLAVAALALTLSACQREPEPPASPTAAPPAAPPSLEASATPATAAAEASSADFDCGGTAVAVRFEGDTATLTLDGETLVLTATPAASGARYEGTRSDGIAVSFWSKGEAARLAVAGNDYPECRPVGPSGLTGYRARGNEPFWLLEVRGTTLRWTTPEQPEPTTWENAERTDRIDGFSLRAAAGGRAIDIAATRGLCRDNMTGMPYPHTVSVELDGATLRGCGGEAIDLLVGAEWAVVQLDDRAVATAAPTLGFDAAGRAYGFGGCNRWTSPLALTGEGLGFARAASTMMACADDAMRTEQAFLDALARVTRHDFDDAGNLLLKAGDDTVIVASRTAARDADTAPPQG